MYDPERGPQRPYQYSPLGGVMAALVPQGTVGCLSGIFLLIVIAVVAGLIEGPWLALAVVALVLLVPLIRRAIRKEIQREDFHSGKPSDTSKLPPDSELSDEERREAMRRFDDERDERR